MPAQAHPTRRKIRWSTPPPRPSARTHAQPYRRRRPETTTLHRIVREHLETYLALANESDPMGGGVPDYVEKEFRNYLKCGILGASTMEDVGFDDRTTEEGRKLLSVAAASLIRDLEQPRIIESWAGLKPIGAENLLVLGPDPELEGLFFATGAGPPEMGRHGGVQDPSPADDERHGGRLGLGAGGDGEEVEARLAEAFLAGHGPGEAAGSLGGS